MIRSTLPATKRQIGEIAEDMFLGYNLSRHSKADTTDATVPVVHVKDVVDGFINPAEMLDRLQLHETRQNARFRLRTSDILVSARGTLMKCALVSPSHSGSMASANFIVIRLKPELRPELLWAFLRHPATQAIMLNRSRGSVQPSLNIKDLQSLEIVVPSLEEQGDLARLVTVSEQLYVAALECARLRRDKAIDIVGQYMEPVNEL